MVSYCSVIFDAFSIMIIFLSGRIATLAVISPKVVAQFYLHACGAITLAELT